MGGSAAIGTLLAKIVQNNPNTGGENSSFEESGVKEEESKPENPQDYLDEALEQQGLDAPPARMKQKWTDGNYNYEVRIHEGNSQYTSSESIYRVARKPVPNPDPTVQGTGTEYFT